MSLQLLNKRTYKHRKTHYVRERFNCIMFRIKKDTCTLFCFFGYVTMKLYLFGLYLKLFILKHLLNKISRNI